MSRSSGVPKLTKSSSTRRRRRSISGSASGASTRYIDRRVRSTASGSTTRAGCRRTGACGNSDRFTMLPVARSSRRAGRPGSARSATSGSANGIGRIVAHGPCGMPARWSTTMCPCRSARATSGVLAGSRSSTLSTSRRPTELVVGVVGERGVEPVGGVVPRQLPVARGTRRRCGVGASRSAAVGVAVDDQVEGLRRRAQPVRHRDRVGCSVPNTKPR